MILLVIDAQIWLTNQDLYCYEKFVSGTKRIIEAARENNIEVIYVQHDNGPGTGFSKGDSEFEIKGGLRKTQYYMRIRLLESYQNKGLMLEALESVIQNASDITDELSYLCRSDDKRSQHIAEKFGFEYFKTFYNVQKEPNDEPKDFLYFILKLSKE